MDLGRRYWAGAGGHKLVEPSFLAPRPRTHKTNRSGARRFRLGLLARPGPGTFFQPRVLALRLARVERLRLWRSGRHGFLQFRHDFSRLEAGGARECGSELKRAVRRDVPAGLGHPLQLPGTWRHATREIRLV